VTKTVGGRSGNQKSQGKTKSDVNRAYQGMGLNRGVDGLNRNSSGETSASEGGGKDA